LRFCGRSRAYIEYTIRKWEIHDGKTIAVVVFYYSDDDDNNNNNNNNNVILAYYLYGIIYIQILYTYYTTHTHIIYIYVTWGVVMIKEDNIFRYIEDDEGPKHGKGCVTAFGYIVNWHVYMYCYVQCRPAIWSTVAG